MPCISGASGLLGSNEHSTAVFVHEAIVLGAAEANLPLRSAWLPWIRRLLQTGGPPTIGMPMSSVGTNVNSLPSGASRRPPEGKPLEIRQ